MPDPDTRLWISFVGTYETTASEDIHDLHHQEYHGQRRAKLTESRARKRALELAEIQDGEQVLEVAVGTGLAFYEIVRRNPNGNNIGIDLSPGMLAKAEQRLTTFAGASYALQLGTAFNLQVENESMDVLENNYFRPHPVR